MNIIDFFKYYVTHTYEGVRTFEEMATWSYLPLIPAIAFYFIQKSRLKFKVIDIAIDQYAFIEAATETAQQLEWQIVKKKHRKRGDHEESL